MLICDDTARVGDSVVATHSHGREADGVSSEWKDKDSGSERSAPNGSLHFQIGDDSELLEGEEDVEGDEEDEEWDGLRQRIGELNGARAGVGVHRDGSRNAVAADEASEGDSSDSRFSALSAFFAEMEQGWRGKVRGKHLRKEYAEVERAARAYEDAVSDGAVVAGDARLPPCDVHVSEHLGGIQ